MPVGEKGGRVPALTGALIAVPASRSGACRAAAAGSAGGPAGPRDRRPLPEVPAWTEAERLAAGEGRLDGSGPRPIDSAPLSSSKRGVRRMLRKKS